MSAKKPFNPFYVALVATGVLFGVTALAYGVMAAVAQNDPGMAQASIESGTGLVAFMDQYGFPMLMIELAVLAVSTFLAIGTDGYWTRRAETQDARPVKATEPTNRE